MRMAIYQCAAGGLDLDARLARLRDTVATHRSDPDYRVELVLCPELFSTGYNVGD